MSRTFERVRTEPGLARNTAVIIALIAIASVVGGIILSNQRFIAPWAQRYIIYAQFEGTPGISPGNGQEVRIAGVSVGDVVGAAVDDSGRPVLELSLTPGDYVIHDNATFELRPKSPLNEMYVNFTDLGGPPGKPLPSGGVLPVGASERPIQIDEVLNHLGADQRQAITDLLAEADLALANAPATLPPGVEAVRTVANRLRPVAEELEKRKEKLRTLITALGQISQAVGRDDKRIQTLADGLQTTLQTLGERDAELDASLANLPGVLSELRNATSAVQGLSDQLDPTLRNLQAASEELPDALEELEGTAEKLDEVVEVGRPFVSAARPVIDDLRPVARELEEGLPALEDSSEELDAITRELLPYLPDAGAFAIQVRSTAGYHDANHGVLRGYLAQPSQTLTPPTGQPNNGVQPVPVPLLDQGTTEFQRQVPEGPTGVPAPPQDGSPSPEDTGRDQVTPDGEEDDNRPIVPGPSSDGGSELLPIPNS